MQMSTNTFITSDTHFNHKNILTYCNRPFRNIDEMNTVLIQNWNSVVSKDDIVYHLGDFAFIKRENNDLSYAQQLKKQIAEFVSLLNGRIILIKGNHDKMSIHQFDDLGFEEVYNRPIHIGDFILTHVPQPKVASNYINIHGHIHNTYIEQFDKPWYINVSTDVTNYTPVNITDLSKL
jgi:calcineurin-like phosphoesterase family protein